MKKFFRRALTAVMIVACMLTAAVVFAEIKTYSGTGRYVMSDFENQDTAKLRARQRAERDAKKQAGVYLKTFSRSLNGELTDDEITAVTNRITNIVGEVQYERKIAEADGEPVIIWTATLTAEINTNGLKDFINRDQQEKVVIVEQDKSLQETFRLNEEQLADLKERYKHATTQVEKDALAEQLKVLDRDFLAAQKLEEADRYSFYNTKREIQLCSEAIELKPDYAEAYIRRGRIYNSFVVGEHEWALQDCNKAIELEPSAENYLERAQCYASMKDYERALQDYTKAIEVEPSAENCLERAGFYEAMKDYERAIQDFNKAIEVEPSAESYLSRAFFYEDMKDYERAIQDFNKAIELEPSAKSYQWRASLYEDMKDYERALQDYNKAIELEPSAESYWWRASFYEDMKDYERALQDYNKAIEYLDSAEVFFGGFMSIHYGLGSKFLSLSSLDQMFKDRGMAYYNLKQYDSAIQDFSKAIELKPNVAFYYNDRGIAYYDLKQYDSAIQDFSKAIELGPNVAQVCFAQYYGWRGACYKALGQNERAIQDFSKAIELNPKVAWYREFRGGCYQALGDNAKAQADFARAKELKGNG